MIKPTVSQVRAEAESMVTRMALAVASSKLDMTKPANARPWEVMTRLAAASDRSTQAAIDWACDGSVEIDASVVLTRMLKRYELSRLT